MQIVKIDFEFDSKYGTFRDAIVLPQDHGMSDADIEALKQARFNAWTSYIENPPVIEEQPISTESSAIEEQPISTESSVSV